MSSAQLTTADGHVLVADIAEPSTGIEPTGGVVVCHPHPQYGGNRFNAVVQALFRALPAAGFRTLRFDFRSVHGGGVAERLDIVSALDELADRGSRPLAVTGYSFGAAVALASTDDRIVALAAIAPPLSMMPTAAAPTVPTFVLTPRHDQFCPPEVAEAMVAHWEHAEFGVIESADHFLRGRSAEVAERTASWLVHVVPGTSWA